MGEKFFFGQEINYGKEFVVDEVEIVRDDPNVYLFKNPRRKGSVLARIRKGEVDKISGLSSRCILSKSLDTVCDLYLEELKQRINEREEGIRKLYANRKRAQDIKRDAHKEDAKKAARAARAEERRRAKEAEAESPTATVPTESPQTTAPVAEPPALTQPTTEQPAAPVAAPPPPFVPVPTAPANENEESL